MFYAHGWGGLPFSSEKAKKLFTEAAELGQPEAKAIIELENKYPPALCHLDNSCISAASGVRSNNESHDITDVIEAVKNLSILKKNGRNNDDLKRNRSSSNSSTGYSSSSSTNGGGILSVYSDLSSIRSSSDVSDPAQKSADNFSGALLYLILLSIVRLQLNDYAIIIVYHFPPILCNTSYYYICNNNFLL